MKNKKIIIIFVIIILAVAIIFGVLRAKYNENYLYDENGTIVDGKSDLINNIKSTEDKNERKNKIDFFLKGNVITQDEANELY